MKLDVQLSRHEMRQGAYINRQTKCIGIKRCCRGMLDLKSPKINVQKNDQNSKVEYESIEILMQ